jgi:uncharacterized protein YdeI (YjbR/CyaY-like superfamily)
VTPPDGLPVVELGSAEAFDAWLAERHSSAPGVWLKIAKKGAPAPTVTYAAAVEVALTYGWIDGQKGRLDDDYWLQRFTARKPSSPWSAINRDKAAALMEAGRMKPAGMREVERAQADGRWERAYAGQRKATVPDDLARELERDAAARAFFESLDSANRYAIVWRIEQAKRPETRARRIEKFVAMLRAGEKLHP